MPHPVTDPRGHSFGVRDQPVELGGRCLPEDWRQVEEYLYGIDLFNAAFFWEAHESWEAVWHAVERDSAVGGFLQGLIQAAAALLQRHCNHRQGSRNLFSRATANFDRVDEWLAARGRADYMGVDLDGWQTELRAYVSGESNRFPFLRLADSPRGPTSAL